MIDEPISTAFILRTIQISLTIFKCRNLKLKNETILNPYVFIQVGDFDKAQTEVSYNTNELTFEGKIFNFSLKLTIHQLKALKISIELWHKTKWYSITDTLIGSYSIDAYKIYSNSNHLLNQEWANLENRSKDAVADPGFVLFSLMVKGEKDKIVALQQEEENEQVDEEQVHKKLNLNDVVQGKPPVDTSKKYTIIVNMFKGHFIKNLSVLGISQLNTFFKIKYNLNDDLKSGTIGNSNEPVYEDEISIPLSYPINTNFIIVEIYHDGGLLSKNVLIGKTMLNFDQLVKDGQLECKWYPLYGPERENTIGTQIKTLIPSFLNFGTLSEAYFYFGRLLISAKFFQDDNPRCMIKHNSGLTSSTPEEIEYKLWVDIFQILQDGGTNLPSGEKLNVEVQVGHEIVEPRTFGKWNPRFKRYEWINKSDSRIKETIIKLPRDHTQIPDIFIRVYTKNLLNWKNYIGYERLKIEPFLKKKNDVKPQITKIRKCETSIHSDSEDNYLGTLLYSLNFFQKNDLFSQERPIPIQNSNKKKFKLISIIYMAKSLPLRGSQLPNSYVSVDFNGCKTKSTNIFQNSDCPVWSEALFISTFLNDCLDLSPNAKVTVYDKGLLTSSEIGSFEVKIGSIKEYIGQHNIENEIYKLAKWYKLTDGIKVTKGEVLAAFFIVKLTKQGKEVINLKNKLIWPEQEKYNLYLFIIGARNVKKNIQGCYTEAKYNNKGLEEIDPDYKNKEKFVRYLLSANTNNLNNYDYLGDLGYITIPIYSHPLFVKPISITINNRDTPLYTAVVDIIRILEENNMINQNNDLAASPQRPGLSDQSIAVVNTSNINRFRDELLPQADDLIPLYKPDKPLPSDNKKYENMFYSTMESFPLDISTANTSKGSEFTLTVKRAVFDKEGKEIKDNEENSDLNRPEIDGDYEETLKEGNEYIDFHTSRLFGDDEDEEDIHVNSNKPLVTGDKGIIRYIIRLVKTSDTQKCEQNKKEVDEIAKRFKSYYSTNIRKKLSPEFICRIYIFSASNISLLNKSITMGYVWTKRYEGDSEYKKSNLQDQFNISQGKVNFFDQIIVIWPETFFLTVGLYGVSEGSVFGDEFIGETKIDLERRYFHKEYQSKLTKNNFSQIPIENRTIYNNGVSRGAVRMLVEIFPRSRDNDFPKTNMERNEKSIYQLRIVIWCVDDIPTINNGKADIQIVATLQDPNSPEKTDVHHNSDDGHGEFNWRMIFDIEYPSEKHYLQISAEDYHLAGSNEPLSSNSYDLEPFLKKIHKTKNAIDVEKHTITLNSYEELAKKGFINGGSVTLQMKFLTLNEANTCLVGRGQEAPNQDPELTKPTTGRDFFDGIGVTALLNKLGGIYDTVFKYVKYGIILIAVGVAAFVISSLAGAFKKNL